MKASYPLKVGGFSNVRALGQPRRQGGTQPPPGDERSVPVAPLRTHSGTTVWVNQASGAQAVPVTGNHGRPPPAGARPSHQRRSKRAASCCALGGDHLLRRRRSSTHDVGLHEQQQAASSRVWCGLWRDPIQRGGPSAVCAARGCFSTRVRTERHRPLCPWHSAHRSHDGDIHGQRSSLTSGVSPSLTRVWEAVHHQQAIRGSLPERVTDGWVPPPERPPIPLAPARQLHPPGCGAAVATPRVRRGSGNLLCVCCCQPAIVAAAPATHTHTHTHIPHCVCTPSPASKVAQASPPHGCTCRPPSARTSPALLSSSVHPLRHARPSPTTMTLAATHAHQRLEGGAHLG